VFRDWQENPNSIFGDGGAAVRDRKWMSGSAPGARTSLGSTKRMTGSGSRKERPSVAKESLRLVLTVTYHGCPVSFALAIFLAT